MKKSWILSPVFWVITVIVMLMVMPNLEKLVLDKGQITLPSDLESVIGTELLNDIQNEGKDTYSFVYVFHQEKGLTATDYSAIEEVLHHLNTNKLLITNALFHTDSEQAANQLVSKDHTTVMAQLSIDRKIGTASEAAALLRAEVKNLPMDTYVTGADIVMDDFSSTTQEGVKKTEIIAVVFIIAILVMIFRSPIIPLISLLTVGVAYAVSLSIIALLANYWNFPFSNFTQVFLVVILFGIGTDYNILLFTRFKEELAKTNHVLKAIQNTYRTAGKTVLLSSSSVLIGFTVLYFSKFTLYQSVSGIAIGICVLLGVLMTLNPFFMALLGFKLFWPSKAISGHTENKLWGFLAKNAFARPIVGIIFACILTVPFIYHFSGELNYNDLVEIDDKYESKQAISLIEKHYEPGMSAPATLVIQQKESLASTDYLRALDELTGIIANTFGVAKVYSPTRPEGERIADLYVNEQANTLKGGLGEAQEGVGSIQKGLQDATKQLSEEQDVSGVQNLINGTIQLQDGASDLTNALQGLTNGLDNAANGSTDLISGTAALEAGLGELQQGLNQLQTSYQQIDTGFQQYHSVFSQIEQLIMSSKQAFEGILGAMHAYVQANPEAAEDDNIQATIKTAQQGLSALNALDVVSLSTQFNQLTQAFGQANTSLANAQSAIVTLKAGARTLKSGVSDLSQGIGTAAQGANQITTGSHNLTEGLAEVKAGQQQLQQQLISLQDSMVELRNGLGEGAEGLEDIYAGLDDANGYLHELSDKETGTFFVPTEVLQGEIQESLNAYMTDDRHATTFMIILDINPYKEEAMTIMRDIRHRVNSYVESSLLQNAEVYLTGKTMSNIDLQEISSADFIRSAVLMLAGISVILWLITRSFLQTLIINASLLIATFASLGLTEMIAKQLLDYDMLSWNVPFFTYIMIVSLGVDYSIFLMMRYNETAQGGLKEIIPTSLQMGSVILAAAVILGGTFAALMPSGVITLIQVAMAVIIGLVILTFMMMPIFIPAWFGFADKIKLLLANRKEKNQ